MSFTPNLGRRLKTIALVVASLATTGCVTFSADLVVNERDEVSGSIVVSYPAQLVDLVAEDPELSDWQKRYEGLDGVSIRGVDENNQLGNEVVFRDVAIEEFSSAGSGPPPLRVVRVEDDLLISGEFDFTGYAEEQSDEAGVVEASYAFFTPADLRVSITVPGDIVSTNGTVDEETNTITWRLRLGQENILDARIVSPAPSVLSGALAWGVFGAVALGTVVGAVIVATGKRHRGIQRRGQGLAPDQAQTAN